MTRHLVDNTKVQVRTIAVQPFLRLLQTAFLQIFTPTRMWLLYGSDQRDLNIWKALISYHAVKVKRTDAIDEKVEYHRFEIPHAN
jgi:hypothetical protein